MPCSSGFGLHRPPSCPHQCPSFSSKLRHILLSAILLALGSFRLAYTGIYHSMPDKSKKKKEGGGRTSKVFFSCIKPSAFTD